MSGGREGRSEVRPAVLRTRQTVRSDLAKDREQALALTPVSRETAERLDRFVDLLFDWQRRVNLIAPSTEPVLWTRHIADSLQLLPLAPDARVWADLGSGAGFPGLVIACALADRPGALVHLVESNGKKTAFLREAARAIDAPVVVHATSCCRLRQKGSRWHRGRHRPRVRTASGIACSRISAVEKWRYRAISQGSGRRFRIDRGRQMLEDSGDFSGESD